VRMVIQRVSRASVSVDGTVVGQIGRGLLVLLGIRQGDTVEQARWLAEKLVGLRLFADAQGKMNASVAEVGGEVLIVSQFTLYGEVQKGRRPSYAAAAGPEVAEPLYAEFVRLVASLGVPTQTGRFGASMAVELVNDGPVTLIVDREAKTAD